MGHRTEAERILLKIIEGDSDVDLSDEENAEDEFEPVDEEVESSEEEAGGSSDELTVTKQDERCRPMWVRTGTYVLLFPGQP